MTPIRILAAATVCFAALSSTPPVQAATWSWDYSAAGIAASGTFTTTDTPDSAGFFTVTAITGSRNGVAITGLEPAGSAIPGNDPYAVDDLVSIAITSSLGGASGFRRNAEIGALSRMAMNINPALLPLNGS